MIHMKLTGMRLKQLCASQGVTVKQIQQVLHIGTHQSIYNWFCGKTLPSVDNLLQLSKLLGLSIEDMLVEDNVLDITMRCFAVERNLTGQRHLQAYLKATF